MNVEPRNLPARMEPGLAMERQAVVSEAPSVPRAAANFNSVSELQRAQLRGEQVTVSDQQFVRALERAIKAMEGKATSLEFSVHEQTKAITVKVLDTETGTIIREIPPEKTLDFIAKLWEMAGLFVDEKR